MADREHRLQQYLNDLEAGAPLESLLSSMPEEEADLKRLLRLAAAMRALPHPELSPAQSDALRRQVLTAGLNGRGPALRPPRRRRLEALAFPLRWLEGLAWVAILALAIWAAVSGVQFDGARDAVVTEMTGRVEVAALEGDDWQVVAPGSVLRAGQRLRTGSASAATLTFSDGSTTLLAANSDVTLATLDGRSGQGLNVHLRQHAGETFHTVVPRGPEVSFTVETPAGTALVQGTAFSVFVDASGHSRFAVESGQVRIAAAGEEVVLAAGQATTALPGRSPGLPANQFRERGYVTGMHGAVWTIGGVPVRLSDATRLSGEMRVGASVSVVGRILANGVWLADSIEAVAEGAEIISFTGTLEVMSGDRWQVDGMTVTVNDQTILDGTPVPGQRVRVTFTSLPDGRWLALRVETLESGVRPSPAGRPSLSFEPDELLASGCGAAFSVSGALVNDGEPPNDEARSIRLGYRVIRGEEFMETAQIAPGGWEVILAGEQVGFTVNLALNESWGAVADGTEVKVQVLASEEANQPGRSPARLTITVVRQCHSSPAASGTPTPSSQFAITPAVPMMPTQTMKPPPAGGPACVGNAQHPVAGELARHFDVSYDEIIGWFCSGFGFGEIRLAYEISFQTGIAVTEVFALRQAGLGWGEIMIQLGVLPGVIPAASSTPEDNSSGSLPPAGTNDPPDGGPPGGAPPAGPPTGVIPTGVPPRPSGG